MAKKEDPKQPEPYDFSGEVGAGLENVRAGDLSIPFLVILQDGSPEVKKTHKDYATKGIKGATAGMILNTVTKELYVTEPGEPGKSPAEVGGSFLFVPCMYQKLYVEWTPREKGGGIVESHADDTLLLQCKKNEKGQDVLPNGNVLQTTAYFFGTAIINNEPIRCVIGLSSTQLKKARQWLNIATNIKFKKKDGSGTYNPPLYSHFYRLSSQPESNEKGSWYGWKIELAGPVMTADVVELAREIYKQVQTGQAKALPPARDDDEVDRPGDGKVQGHDESAPFG